MKIAIVMWKLSVSGGGERQVLELANYLVHEKNDVKIYCVYLDKEACYPDLIKKFNIITLYNQKRSLSQNIAKRLFPSLIKFFVPILEPLFSKQGEEFADLVAKDFNDVDIINFHSPLCDNYIYRAAYICKKKHRVPVVWMMNDLPGNLKVPETNCKIKFSLDLIRGGPIGRYIDKRHIAQIDQIVVLDKMNRDLVKRYIGLETEIVRSGLDLEKFKFRKRQPDKKHFKVLATGIFLPHRRFEDLVTALNILKKEGYRVILNIIGSDEYNKAYAKKIVELVSMLNLEGEINFLGVVSEEDLVSYYSNSDVFVFPNYPQTWGLAVFEAMACGTPVVVSTGCGASEVLSDGENALLVSPRRPEEIAVRLKQLLNDEKLWQHLSVNGRKFVEENISWNLYGKKMLQLFKNVMKRR